MAQGFPGFPCLNQVVFEYIVEEHDSARLHVLKEDIPFTASCEAVLSWTDSLDECDSVVTLDACLLCDTSWVNIVITMQVEK